MKQLHELLDRIEQLDQEATPEPWTERQEHPEYATVEHKYYAPTLGINVSDPVVETTDTIPADVEFITLARTALPQLAKALRAVLAMDIPNDVGPGADYDGYGQALYDIERTIAEAMKERPR